MAMVAGRHHFITKAISVRAVSSPFSPGPTVVTCQYRFENLILEVLSSSSLLKTAIQ